MEYCPNPSIYSSLEFVSVESIQPTEYDNFIDLTILKSKDDDPETAELNAEVAYYCDHSTST